MTKIEIKTSEFSDYLRGITPRGRTMLLPALLEAQKHYGYISPEIAAEIGSALRVPLADVTGVIEFYSMLYTEPTGETIIRVCTSPSCSASGGRQVHNEILNKLNIQNGSSTPDGKYFVEKVECLGLCDQAPATLVDDVAIGRRFQVGRFVGQAANPKQLVEGSGLLEGARRYQYW